MEASRWEGGDGLENGGLGSNGDPAPRVARLSPAKRAILAGRRRAGGVAAAAIPARPPGAPLVLSWAQERVWLLEQLRDGRSAYNAPRAVRLRGPLDPDALQAALDEIVRPLLRALLLRLGPDHHVLTIVSHHIASDEPSKRLVAAELEALYAAYRAGRPSPLPPLALQYGDYAAWQRDGGGGQLERELAYWTETLAGAPPTLELPTDRPRPPIETHAGTKLRSVLPPSVSDAVRALGRVQHSTPFMTLLAGFAALLEHWSGQDDLVVGTPITSRSHAELEPLIGFFSNTLALRIRLGGNPTFTDVVARTRDACTGAYANQKLPFERLVQELRPERDLSRNPIFQVMFTLRPGGISALRLEGLETEILAVESGASKFDLNVIAMDGPTGIVLVWEYNTDLFDAGTIERLAGRYKALLSAVAAQPDLRLSELDVLGPEDRAAIDAWNDTAAPSPVDACVHTLVGERAAAVPGAPAVRGAGRELSYAELWARSQGLARALRARGVGCGSLVGVWADRTPELLVAVLGVLAAGGAYVPLEPTYPPARLAATVADAGLALVVVPSGDVSAAAAFGTDVLGLDDLELSGIAGAGPIGTDVAPTDLAYVVYTSGSTGRPKGVMVEHAGVVNLLRAMSEDPGLSAGEVMVGLTTPAFDLSVPDLFLPLVCGATLVLADRETAADPRALATLLDREQAGLVQATPTTWAMLCESGWAGRPGLRAVCGGERFPASLASDLASRGVRVWNFYGPTEATVWATSARLGPSVTDPVPLGRPLANVRGHVLDGRGRPVPVGSVGELHLAGAGLARGYHDQPDRTAEAFPRGAAAPPGEDRAYRTGDLVRRRPDGGVVFVGRRDDQVKVRGFRIELGEIEAVLGEQPGVASAACSVRDDLPGGPGLVGYVVPAGTLPSVEDLRSALALALPSYMVPSDVVTLAALPLTANGKVDRRALPAPDRRSSPGEDGGGAHGRTAYVAPRNPAEEALAGIWSQLLGIDRISVTDNFFDLGGHSMLAARMVARVERAFRRTLPLAIVMQAGTIEAMAAILVDDGGRDLWRCVVPIKTGDARLPLFCVHGMAGVITGYRHLFPHLSKDQRVYGIQVPGLDGKEPPLRRVEDLAARYIDEIRAIQPEGPYLVAGVCFGAMVAFEMAHQLSEAGAEVALVALIDPPVLRSGLQQIRRRVAKFKREPHGSRMRFMRETVSILLSLLNRAAWDVVTRPRGGRNVAVPRRPHAMEAVNRRAGFLYEPPNYTGRLVLYRSDGLRALEGEGHALAWRTLAGDSVEVLDVPGTTHRTLFRDPYVGVVATHLQERIDEAVALAAAGNGAPASRGVPA
ncbi:MAG: amino acid adenylation domain-containing protein [Actinobacteria bacterium]|nr:amino acid adenylation domain-containing protein [Actinomycetota bacterium]